MSATETEIFSPTYRVGQQAKKHTSGFWHLLTLVRPHYWLMTLTIGSGILNQGLTIASAAVGAYLVGLAVVARSIAPLLPWLVALGVLVLGRAVMAWVEMWLAHDLAYRVLADIRGQLYWSLEQLAPSYLLDRRSGDVAAAAMGDAET
ncbi:MAG: hypothetical protein JO125_14555, partial [Chloroflexi bacterium]|nr:hypothetical protein [Chloroflexota bacterium]